MSRKPLDARSLRAVARWHRRQFVKSSIPGAWEAHLLSETHWQDKARAIEHKAKPVTSGKRKAEK